MSKANGHFGPDFTAGGTRRQTAKQEPANEESGDFVHARFSGKTIGTMLGLLGVVGAGGYFAGSKAASPPPEEKRPEVVQAAPAPEQNERVARLEARAEGHDRVDAEIKNALRDLTTAVNATNTTMATLASDVKNALNNLPKKGGK